MATRPLPNRSSPLGCPAFSYIHSFLRQLLRRRLTFIYIHGFLVQLLRTNRLANKGRGPAMKTVWPQGRSPTGLRLWGVLFSFLYTASSYSCFKQMSTLRFGTACCKRMATKFNWRGCGSKLVRAHGWAQGAFTRRYTSSFDLVVKAPAL